MRNAVEAAPSPLTSKETNWYGPGLGPAFSGVHGASAPPSKSMLVPKQFVVIPEIDTVPVKLVMGPFIKSLARMVTANGTLVTWGVETGSQTK